MADETSSFPFDPNDLAKIAKMGLTMLKQFARDAGIKLEDEAETATPDPSVGHDLRNMAQLMVSEAERQEGSARRLRILAEQLSTLADKLTKGVRNTS